jgi:GAF domain-containing protein
MYDLHSAKRRCSQTSDRFTRALAIHESTARVLRDNGREAAAQRVDRLAAVARDRIDQPAAMSRMHALALSVRRASDLDEVLDHALDGAIAFLGADFGSIQLAHPRTKVLRLMSQRGFDDDFLAHFAVVGGGQTVYGRADRTRARTVVADVETDPGFGPHRSIAAASGFRAVLSVLLIDKEGELRGVLSTHFRRPHRPADHELRLIDAYARMVADEVASRIAQR